jgi:DNA-binding response OmpR family regulator
MERRKPTADCTYQIANPNTVLKREKILLELWGSDDYFLGRSLDVFISRLRKIIKEETHVRIENIPRVGFKLVVED